jgi:hypothetical protein
MWSNGRVTQTTLYWQEGFDEWLPLSVMLGCLEPQRRVSAPQVLPPVQSTEAAPVTCSTAMSIQVYRAVVRIAAVVTVLTCGGFIWRVIVIGFDTSSSLYSMLRVGFAFLVAIGIIRESVRAWWFLPTSIESLSAVWIIAGFMGVFVGLVPGFADGWKIWNAACIAIGVLLFSLGVWMSEQRKRLNDVA